MVWIVTKYVKYILSINHHTFIGSICFCYILSQDNLLSVGRGIFLMFGDEVDVKCNAIHGNRGDGIHIDQEFPVTVKDNSVTCNAGNGLITSDVGEVTES